MRLIRLWPDDSRFDFMKFRRFSFPLSALFSMVTVVLLLTVGLNFGIDFKGGTLMELQAKSGQADVGKVRQAADSFGFGAGRRRIRPERGRAEGARHLWGGI
ncbi:MAG: secF [Microvirga sp.]|nr:secF [Microvirga sp.]